MRIDIGKLTPDETKALAAELLNTLTEDDACEVLENCLSVETKERLGESWFNIDSARAQ